MTTDKLPWPGNVLLPNVPHEFYHSDPWGNVPCLSQSVATQVLKCPLKGWAAHPRLGGATQKIATPEMDQGTLLHALVLGAGPVFVQLDHEDYKTKAAREAKQAVLAAGQVPVLTHKYQAALEAATAILRAIREQQDIDIGELEVEQVALWTDPALGVRCKARFDALDKPRGHIYDPKFTSLEPSAWIAGMKRSGYDVQAAAYTEAAEAIFPDLAGRVEFTPLLIDPTWPHATCLVEIGGSMRSLGQDRWHRAKLTWKKGLETGLWPTYPPATAEAPNWALEEELLRSIEMAEEAYSD